MRARGKQTLFIETLSVLCAQWCSPVCRGSSSLCTHWLYNFVSFWVFIIYFFASVQEQLPTAHSWAVWSSDVKFGVSAPLANVDFRNIRLADFGTGQVNPGIAFVTLDHRPASERLHAEAGDKMPGVIICKRLQQSVMKNVALLC